ncbi:hypothetical protein RGQ15_11645 [Paracoccus sp. MBLB3053]|uniref:Uncharacterized protein n=1 Tax=Paracoccus aurantius TaxID=3073814 RepID=A0ABU2HT43_9RHOB|nr:hypothetical protein [Paracoccus sp. MBLB3053]MDS9468220.1 hypothetical protein [Paracoccus sp. MBLB3053]
MPDIVRIKVARRGATGVADATEIRQLTETATQASGTAVVEAGRAIEASAVAETSRSGAVAAQTVAQSERTAAEIARAGAESAALTLGATSYATLSALQAVAGTGNARGYVYADGTDSNNGLYFWGGGIWLKDPLDPRTRIAIIQAITEQVEARIASIFNDDTSRPELVGFSILDESKNVLLGLDTEAWEWLFGLAIRLGIDKPVVTTDNARFLFSIDDEDGYSFFAVTRPDASGDVKLIVGGQEVGGATTTVDESIGEIGQEAAARNAHTLPVPDNYFLANPVTTPGSGWFPIARPTQQAIYLTNGANNAFDLTHMPGGHIADIIANHANLRVWSGIKIEGSIDKVNRGEITARNFMNRSENMLTMNAGDVVRVYAINGNVLVVVLAGSPVFSSEAIPVMDKSILMAGQSNCVNWAETSGPAGFVEGLRDDGWMGSSANRDLSSFFFMEGATGATALFKSDRSDNAHWINDDDPLAWTDGPAMEKCRRALSTGLALGQPAPEVIRWDKDEAETRWLEDGTLSIEEVKAGQAWILTRLRAACIAAGATNPQVIMTLLGSYDSPDVRRRKGGTAARQATLENIAAYDWAHMGGTRYDLQRGPNEIHGNGLGYFNQGYRDGRAFANAMLGQSQNMGPTLVSVTDVGNGQFDAVFTATGRMVMPRGNISQNVAGGPYPYGFTLIAAGGDATDEHIPLLRAEVINETTIRFTADAEDVEGCKLAFPAGYYPEAMSFAFIRDSDARPGVPGLPLVPFISEPL